ncbi:hypothetical protein NT05LI_2529a, partial [Listeria ivanovii FSL F6-596]
VKYCSPSIDSMLQPLPLNTSTRFSSHCETKSVTLFFPKLFFTFSARPESGKI